MQIKWLSLLLVLALLGIIIAPSWAQDDWQTYTADDESLSFQYPADWYVYSIEENQQTILTNSIQLVNRPVGNINVELDEGQVAIIMGSFEGPQGNVTIYGLPDSVEYNVGMLSMSLIFSLQLYTQLYGDNEPIDVYFDQFEPFEVNGSDGGQIDANYGGQSIRFMMVDFDGNLLGFSVRTYGGELDSYEDIIMQVLENIVYKPTSATDATTSYALDDLMRPSIIGW